MPVEISEPVSWWIQAEDQGIVDDEASSDAFTSNRIDPQFAGVSLDFLERFALSVPSEITTRGMVSSILAPAMTLAGKGGRLWDYIPTQHKGRPSW